MDTRGNQPRKVADMISVFSKDEDKTTSPHFKKKEDKSSKLSEQKSLHPPTPPTTEASTLPRSSYIKLIHVTESGKVVDQKDPRCARTMDYFRGGRVGNSKPLNSEPAIKTMSFQGSVYSSPTRKLSTPITVKNNTIPRSVSHNSSLSSLNTSSSKVPQQTTRDSTTTSTSITKSVVAEKHHGGVYYKTNIELPTGSNHTSVKRPASVQDNLEIPTSSNHTSIKRPTSVQDNLEILTNPNQTSIKRPASVQDNLEILTNPNHTSIKRPASVQDNLEILTSPNHTSIKRPASVQDNVKVTRAIKQPGGTWFSSSTSTASSSFKIPTVQTWDKIEPKGIPTIKRSKSFTTQIDVSVRKTNRKPQHRSSLVLDFNGDDHVPPSDHTDPQSPLRKDSKPILTTDTSEQNVTTNRLSVSINDIRPKSTPPTTTITSSITTVNVTRIPTDNRSADNTSVSTCPVKAGTSVSSTKATTVKEPAQAGNQTSGATSNSPSLTKKIPPSPAPKPVRSVGSTPPSAHHPVIVASSSLKSPSTHKPVKPVSNQAPSSEQKDNIVEHAMSQFDTPKANPQKTNPVRQRKSPIISNLNPYNSPKLSPKEGSLNQDNSPDRSLKVSPKERSVKRDRSPDRSLKMCPKEESMKRDRSPDRSLKMSPKEGSMKRDRSPDRSLKMSPKEGSMKQDRSPATSPKVSPKEGSLKEKSPDRSPNMGSKESSLKQDKSPDRSLKTTANRSLKEGNTMVRSPKNSPISSPKTSQKKCLQQASPSKIPKSTEEHITQVEPQISSKQQYSSSDSQQKKGSTRHDMRSSWSSAGSPRISRRHTNPPNSPTSTKKVTRSPPTSVKSKIALFQSQADKADVKTPLKPTPKIAPTIPPKPRKPVAPTTKESGLSSDDDSEDETKFTNTGLRISSVKDENEMTINVSMFGSSSLQQATPFVDTDKALNRENSESEYDDIVFTPNTDSKPDDDIPSSSIYSYREYVLMRKGRCNTLSTSSLSSEPVKPLEVIPEVAISIPSVSPLPQSIDENDESGRYSANLDKQSSSDSESELVRRLSHISNTFYEEMLDSIKSKIGIVSDDDTGLNEKVTKHLAEVMDQMVRNAPAELTDQTDCRIYETLEEYGRKVSNYIIYHNNRQNDDGEPPELPPRPDFLLKLLRDDNEENSSPLFLDDLKDYEDAGGPMFEDTEAYEAESFNNNDTPTKSLKKKKKSPKRAPKKRTPEHKATETNDTGSPKQERRVASRKEDRRMGVKRKFTLFSGRSSKVEPSGSSGALTLPQRRSEHELMEYDEMTGSDLNQPAHMYMNVGRGRSHTTNATIMQQSHSYNNIGNHGDLIEPVNTSESEDEDYDHRLSIGSQSPSKVRWKDSDYQRDYLTYTPDSEFFSETQSNHRFNNDPMTPPLVTKLSVSSSAPSRYGLRISNSDPSLHNSLLQVQNIYPRIRGSITISPSPSPILNHGDLSLDSIISDGDSNSTPSVCSLHSNRGNEFKCSPAMRKRIRSDASHDRYSVTRRGAQQKAQLVLAQKKRRRGSLPGSTETEGVIEVPLVYADALMDCTSHEHDELSFRVNDVIAVLDMRDDDWWQGIVDDRIGWFPASWVRLRIDQDIGDSSSLDLDIDLILEPNDTTTSIPKSTSLPETPQNTMEPVEDDELPELSTQKSHTERVRRISTISTASTVSRRKTIRKRDSGDLPRCLTPEEIRAKCIEEILHTEIDYVQHLHDIVEGFLYPCQQHHQLFNEESVETIFSNIEDIYKFQQEFLAALKARINKDRLQDSLIGKLFVTMRDKFSMYSEYCNNHPHAVNEMNLLHQDQQYSLFFEGCRLLRNMTKISLEGFLLTPVQRICRYPLQLSELVKHTPETHPDFHDVLAAQDAMTQVAVLINDRKRRMEDLGRIKNWQDSVENWKGGDVLERSTEQIYFSELHKISKGHSQERHFFLFDHQLIYCRKDTIGGKLSYKGRVDLDKCEIIDIQDGELSHGGSALKNAWKVSNVDKDKWYVLFAKTPQAKQEWMDAFRRERQRVQEDEASGFVITPKMKRAAIALFNASSEPIGKKYPKKNHDWATDSITSSGQLTPRPKYDSSGSFSKITNSPTEKKRQKKKR